MKLKAFFLSLAFIPLAAAAHAATASVATANVNLRAGPGTAYPVVRVVPAGSPVATFGCLAGYTWCDIGYAGARGWVSASYITVTYGGTKVVVTPVIAPRVAIPVITYSEVYWHTHYHAYPWYRRGPAYYRPPVVRPRGPCWDGCSVNRSVTGPRGNTRSGSIIFNP
ncbi:SH3 domain-containing protein [Rhizobium cremeum]|uniref:SH3 domain-containing protein n=1 Tax=Rhizobium cremeum TaxID=2813827 RepID=UPI000DDB0518|nr:SH3 domain-containing protein [Rhizobium cremeum]MCJ7997087.1 SH3 domain-containing protein [Rhizobium cremeum]MCJ8002305.1 SH3 domain-containing protein [Rhizobium cremeum]